MCSLPVVPEEELRASHVPFLPQPLGADVSGSAGIRCAGQYHAMTEEPALNPILTPDAASAVLVGGYTAFLRGFQGSIDTAHS